MKTSTLNTLGKTILFLGITITMSHAGTQENNSKENTLDTTVMYTNYQCMPTDILQREVEEHSKNGTLSFGLGQELIKRWTKS